MSSLVAPWSGLLLPGRPNQGAARNAPALPLVMNGQDKEELCCTCAPPTASPSPSQWPQGFLGVLSPFPQWPYERGFLLGHGWPDPVSSCRPQGAAVSAVAPQFSLVLEVLLVVSRNRASSRLSDSLHGPSWVPLCPLQYSGSISLSPSLSTLKCGSSMSLCKCSFKMSKFTFNYANGICLQCLHVMIILVSYLPNTIKMCLDITYQVTGTLTESSYIINCVPIP